MARTSLLAAAAFWATTAAAAPDEPVSKASVEDFVELLTQHAHPPA
jgi:hypothetical protein